ncbi:MAG: response regulator transcription factor [Oscillospiraceae bacterium]|nr:response regulator transcription factor [Oscillospiraceae bacterium]
MAVKILIVDDEPKIAETVKAYLEADGYDTQIAASGVEALRLFREQAPDLVLLDLMLPDIDGEQVCTLIRAESDVPVVMLTAKSAEDSFLKGFSVGADDYVTKPFSPKVLVAKVGAVLRRTAKDEPQTLFSTHDIELNDIEHTVVKNGAEIELTPSEYNILLTLLKSPGAVFSRRQLIQNALGGGFTGDERMIDSYIKQLRAKIEDDTRNPKIILTVHGFGYKSGK